MNSIEKNNPRHERPFRRDLQARRQKLENKEQEILKEERTNRNRPCRSFGRTQNRGMRRHQHQPVHAHQRPHRHFGWHTEEAYRTDEVTPKRGDFHPHANHPLNKRKHWAVQPHRSGRPTPERAHRHRWAMRPRHADEFRREGGEFQNRHIRKHSHQAQPGQQRHPRHILREKWMLEEKLFRITRRILRLNHQLRV